MSSRVEKNPQADVASVNPSAAHTIPSDGAALVCGLLEEDAMADELSEKYGEKNMGSDERSNTYGFTAEHHRQVTGHGVEISHTGAWKCPTCKAKGKA